MTKQKLVVWDVDGPINYRGRQGTVPADCCYTPGFRSGGPPGDDSYDFVVKNSALVKLTLDILHQNNITSVIGSQRIQMQDDDPSYGNFVKAMYGGLDHFFDNKRPYLNEELARKIGGKIANENTQVSKNMLLKAYQDEFNCQPQDIILIDDHDGYGTLAEEAEHMFVLAPGDGTYGAASNSYLFETLLRIIPVHDIYNAMEQSNVSNTVKNDFKKELVSYQLNNLEKVTTWQEKVLVEEGLLKYEQPDTNTTITPSEKSAKQVLQGIQYLVMDTKWDIGFLGGVRIVDEKTGLSNTVPKGMNQILNAIKQAQDGKTSWDDALKNVEKIVETSSAKKDHGFLNQRSEATQIFYEQTKQRLIELRSNEKAPEEELKNATTFPKS